MNKQDLASAVADSTGLTKSDSHKAVDAFIDIVTSTLKKGSEIRIAGFGTFRVAKRAARVGRNPQTGAAINIPASKQPKFSAGKSLKDAVNKR
ncbi:MAG: HU family DNA-binding protein [Rhodospirillales bacterium]|nr:HU family DNA-binding protein [Rhodospirillales bacterium]